jgi:soluble cytochrome b562
VIKMSNTILLDLNLLSEQQDKVNNSDIDKDTKEGLNEMFSTILDMAEDYKQEGEIRFVMEIKDY